MAIDQKDFERISQLVRRKAGIVLEVGKEYLVEARVSALAKRHNLTGIPALMEKLRGPQAAEFERDIVDAMTTNETSFFRDIHPFEALKTVVMPDLLAKRESERRLNIWCAASSTGQEPYTLALILREHFPKLLNWKVTFIASDLSRDTLNRAKAGRYSQLEVNRGLPAPLLVKYFKRDGLEWELREEIRKTIDFREINLLEKWPTMMPLDLVFIRNVLIYFDNETKKKILGRIREMLRPGGYLFLGGAETTLNLDDNFERLQNNKSGYYGLRTRIAAAA